MKRLLITTFMLLLGACHKQQTKVEKPTTPVRVTQVDVYQPKNAARYSASIQPARQVGLSFRVSGLVKDIFRIGGRGLEPGDVIPAGTVLGRLREEDYNNSATQAISQLESARESQKGAAAQLAQAEASQAKANADFARAKALLDSQSLTQPEFDSAKAQRDVADAQVAAARANLDSAAAGIRNAQGGVGTARLAQADTALVAPFTASVVQRNIEVGMLAGPSLTAYSLADVSSVKAVFGVPDTVVVNLRPGRTINVSIEALPGRAIRGTVTAVAAVADGETKLFQVELAISNNDRRLKPGMIAALELEDTAIAPAMPVVPLSSVVRDRSNPNTFAVMVVEGKTAKARRVSLGPAFGERLAVTSGLKPGELVIRAGGTLVSDGDAVEVIQ